MTAPQANAEYYLSRSDLIVTYIGEIFVFNEAIALWPNRLVSQGNWWKHGYGVRSLSHKYNSPPPYCKNTFSDLLYDFAPWLAHNTFRIVVIKFSSKALIYLFPFIKCPCFSFKIYIFYFLKIKFYLKYTVYNQQQLSSFESFLNTLFPKHTRGVNIFYCFFVISFFIFVCS